MREASAAAEAAAAAGPWVCGAGGERQSATARRSGSGGFRAGDAAEAPEKEGAADMARGGGIPTAAAAATRPLPAARLDGASWSRIPREISPMRARGGAGEAS